MIGRYGGKIFDWLLKKATEALTKRIHQHIASLEQRSEKIHALCLKIASSRYPHRIVNGPLGTSIAFMVGELQVATQVFQHELSGSYREDVQIGLGGNLLFFSTKTAFINPNRIIPGFKFKPASPKMMDRIEAALEGVICEYGLTEMIAERDRSVTLLLSPPEP